MKSNTEVIKLLLSIRAGADDGKIAKQWYGKDSILLTAYYKGQRDIIDRIDDAIDKLDQEIGIE